MRERGVERMLRGFELTGRRPRQWGAANGRLSGGCNVAANETRLALACPVVELSQRQILVVRESAFRVDLRVAVVVQSAECRCHPSQRSDQSQLRATQLDDKPEPVLLRKCETLFALRLRFR